MREDALFEKIDLHLIRVLHTVLTERNVSRAAVRLGMHQPAVSAALKRLRDLVGDPLLVRTGSGMVPTDTALRMIEPSARILQDATALFSDVRGFDPRSAHHTFRLATSGYLNPLFLPLLLARIKELAPTCPVELLTLSSEAHYHDQLASGTVDVVIGNWPDPPEDLHLAWLSSDEVACMVSRHHPAVRRGWSVQEWLDAEHIAPGANFPGARGVVDLHLANLGLQRRIMARCSHFSLIPEMVAQTLLVFTTGRRYCVRAAERLPLVILPCPVELPPLRYYQLWHPRTQPSAAAAWLREQVKMVDQMLQNQ